MRHTLAALLLLLASCAVRTGQPLPPFSVQDLDGHTWTAAALRGHPAVIDLWSPACLACVSELPAFKAMAEELGPKGLVVLGLYEHGGTAAGRSIADSAELGFPLAHAGGTLMWKLGGTSVPTTLFVDSSGRVRHVFHGTRSWADLFAQAEALLPSAAQP